MIMSPLSVPFLCLPSHQKHSWLGTPQNAFFLSHNTQSRYIVDCWTYITR